MVFRFMKNNSFISYLALDSLGLRFKESCLALHLKYSHLFLFLLWLPHFLFFPCYLKIPVGHILNVFFLCSISLNCFYILNLFISFSLHKFCTPGKNFTSSFLSFLNSICKSICHWGFSFQLVDMFIYKSSIWLTSE